MLPGMGGMNPAQIKSMMKQLGIQSEDLKVNKVIFEMDDKNLVIETPSVTSIEMQGQKTFQVMGAFKEEPKGIPEDDVKLVSQQANVSEAEARKALEKNSGDIAQAIAELSK